MLRTALALAWLGAAPMASGGGNPYLLQAQRLYEEVQYEQCVGRLDQATRWENSAVERVDIEVYAALCKYPLGRVDEARQHFELALMLDPDVKIPPTSPKIQALFEDVKARVRTDAPLKQPPARVTNTRPDAHEPPSPSTPSATHVIRTRRPKLGPALVGGGAAAALTAGIVSGVRARHLEMRANTTYFQSDARRHASDARSAALVANIAYAGAGLLAAGAVMWFLLADDAADPE